MTVRVFGIRHHGPGSARALASSLEVWEPDVVLIEGPPEADPVLALAGSEEMRPPVALLAYLPSRPGRSSFYPLASWSPEWVAIRHALARQVPVRMIDLPASAFLARSLEPPPAGGDPDPTAGPAPPGPAYGGDPLAQLASAAGYDDTERWWEDVIEHRRDGEPWDAITEAMAALRAATPSPSGRDTLTEARREASMRRHIRAADKAFERVAVVCGAWHAPALVERGPARPDDDLLRGLPRDKAAVTWVPWTNGRLSFTSGYGAGVASPGWYEHLFVSPDRPVERWLIKVATLLREERIDAPPASVIDAVRLADALATLRGRPLAGLSECTDAARSAMAGGYDSTLELIDRKLVVGDAIGEVPPDTPMVALAADLAAQQRRLRLRPEPGLRYLDLDLRREIDLGRSRLLHRLDLLGVPWGVVEANPRGTGTFREEWTLGWEPELSVRVIEASVHGNTVADAATARARERAAGADRLDQITDLIERCLLADLPGALPAVMSALDTRAALATDVNELMDAVLPLARALRYGSVRRAEAGPLRRVVSGIVTRARVSLGPACASLDDDAARAVTGRVAAVAAALSSLDPDEGAGLYDEWLGALVPLSRGTTLHGLLAGRSARLLLDAGRLDRDEVARRLSLALSRSEDPVRGAAWVEGLVAGSGLLLVHDRALLAVIDEWLARVQEDVFDQVLPLLRRSFADFAPAERRLIGEAAARRGAGGATPPDGTLGGSAADWGPSGLDEERAAAVLPLLARLLGPDPDEPGRDGDRATGDRATGDRATADRATADRDGPA